MMKNFVLLAISMLIALSLNANAVPCVNCEPAPLTFLTYTVSVPEAPNCIIEVKVTAKKCPDGRCNFDITEINITGPYCYFELEESFQENFLNYSNFFYNVKMATMAQIVAGIDFTSMGCAPAPGNSAIVIYTSRSCWKWEGILDPFGTNAKLVPCNAETCCLANWTISNIDGIYTIIPGVTEVTGECWPGCYAACW